MGGDAGDAWCVGCRKGGAPWPSRKRSPLPFAARAKRGASGFGAVRPREFLPPVAKRVDGGAEAGFPHLACARPEGCAAMTDRSAPPGRDALIRATSRLQEAKARFDREIPVGGGDEGMRYMQAQGLLWSAGETILWALELETRIEGFADLVSRENRSEFQDAIRRLRSLTQEYVDTSTAVATSQDVHAARPALEILPEMIACALAIGAGADTIQIPEDSDLEMRVAALRRVLARLIALAASARRTLVATLAKVEPQPEHDERDRKSGAERARALRARRAQGVVLQVPVNLYAGDLDLLRRYGFLGAGDGSDREALAASLETFIAAAFLGLGARYPWGGGVTWRDLAAKQAGRIAQISGRERDEKNRDR